MRQGRILRDIEAGSPLAIIGGPVVGNIRYDNNTVGEWYQVRVGDDIGWLWAGRIATVQ